MSYLIRTENLTKKFGRITAVDALSIEVGEGELFGFLGPNGSGKSTVIRMLLGLVFPTSGEVELLGARSKSDRLRALRDVGAMIEGPGFYPGISGRRNLMMFDAAGPGSSVRGRRNRVGNALEQVGLAGIDRRPVRTYSMGMKQRLALANAILRHPKLLVLDEPTNGLDPQGIRELRDLFLQLVADGTTIFLSSHLLAEVELLCTSTAMMSSGRLVALGTIEEFTRPTGRMIAERYTLEDAYLQATGGSGDARR